MASAEAEDSPAHTGIHPGRLRLSRGQRRLPRTDGDPPKYLPTIWEFFQVAPRARGSTGGVVPPCCGRRGRPTRTGKHRRPGTLTPTDCGLPRAHGEPPVGLPGFASPPIGCPARTGIHRSCASGRLASGWPPRSHGGRPGSGSRRRPGRTRSPLARGMHPQSKTVKQLSARGSAKVLKAAREAPAPR